MWQVNSEILPKILGHPLLTAMIGPPLKLKNLCLWNGIKYSKGV